MSHPLDGAFAKLDRAETQTHVLNEQIKAFIEADDPQPYTIRKERHNECVQEMPIESKELRRRFLAPSDLVGPTTDAPFGVVTAVGVCDVSFRIEANIPLPVLQFGVILGEIVHNLRCALDFLIWELSVKAQQYRPPDVILPRSPDTKWKRLQFPITMDNAGWKNAIKGNNLWALDQTTIDDIEKLQPYYGGKAAADQPLWWLQELWNIDKHRTIPIIIMVGELEFSVIVGRRIIANRATYGRGIGPFDDGAELQRVEIAWLLVTGEQDFDPTMEMHPQITVDIAFGKGSVVGYRRAQAVIREMTAEVGSILKKFKLSSF
jgi:hypothetical protein